MTTLLRFVDDTRRGGISSGSGALTLSTGTFVSGDVGKGVTVVGAGASGADLVTTVSAFTDATHVTLTDSASTTVATAIVTYTRLSLNDDSGFHLLRGLNLGLGGLEKVWLGQMPYDGAVLAATRQDIVQMEVPVRLTKQSSWSAVKTLMESLRTELARDTNVIEYRPEGASQVYLIDTYRADRPSLFHGQAAPNPAYMLMDTEGFTLIIDRDPDMRGAGSGI